MLSGINSVKKRIVYRNLIIEKLAGYISIFIAALFLLCVIVFYLSAKEMHVRQFEKSNDRLVEQVAISFETVMKQIKDSAARVSLYDDELLELVKAHNNGYSYKQAVLRKLENVLYIDECIHSVYLYMSDFDEVYSTNSSGIHTLETFEDSGVLKDFKGVGIYSLSPRQLQFRSHAEKNGYINPDNNKLVISVLAAVPLYGESNRGRLVVNIDANQVFNSILKRIRAESEINFYVYDSNGVIIIDKEGTNLFKNIDEKQAVKKVAYPDLIGYLLNRNILITSVYNSQKLYWNFILETRIASSDNFYFTLGRFLLFFLLIAILAFAMLFAVNRLIRPMKGILERYGENIWRDFLTGVFSNLDNLNDLLKGAGTSPKSGKYAVIVIQHAQNEAFDIGVFCDSLETKESKSSSDLYSRIIKQVSINKNHEALVINLQSSSCELQKELENVIEKVDSCLQRRGIADYCLACSCIKEGTNQIPDCFKECMEVLDYKIWFNTHVMLYTIIADGKYKRCSYPYTYEKQLLNNITAGNTEESVRMMKCFMDSILDGEGIPDDHVVKNYIFQLHVSISNRLNQMGISNNFNNDLDLLNIHDTVRIKDLLCSYISKIAAEVDMERQAKETELPDALLSSINAGYRNNEFNLNMLAEMFKISRTWVGKLVREKTGMSFNDYVNEKRIAFAKELLQNKELSIDEVSHKAGFTYSHYFIKVFKEAEGITPGQYRSAWQINQQL